MASEIRANKQTNRVGLGTVTYTDTGIIVSGISTATNFKTGSSNLHSTGLNVGAGDELTFVHSTGINLGTGVTLSNIGNATFSGISTFNEIKLSDGNKAIFGTGSDLEIFHSSGANYIKTTSAQNLVFGTNVTNRIILQSDGHLRPVADSTYDLGLTATRFRNIYADTYYGDGANLTNLPAGAPVGGASTNTVFFENDKAVAVNYQVTSTKNAMSAGPIAINAGIAVTVPSGCSWTIV